MSRRAQFTFSSTYSESSDVPPWVDALLVVLAADLDPSDPVVLSPVYALREARLIARSVVGGAPAPWPADRTSLRVDLGSSLKPFESNLEREAGVARKAVASQLESLPEELASPPGANLFLGSVEALLDVLASESAVRAAWQDVKAAFQAPGKTQADLQDALLIVSSQLDLRGVDWNERTRRVTRVYADWIGEICRARGEQLPPGKIPTEGSGTSFEERDQLSDDVIAAPAQQTDAIVHLALGDATLPQGQLSVGSRVTLYTYPEWLRCFAEENSGTDQLNIPPERPNIPHEMVEHRETMRKLVSRIDEATVFARIVLADVSPARAASTARTVLRDVLDVVDVNNTWTIYDGHFVALDAGYSSRGFTTAEDSASGHRNAGWTARRLESAGTDERVELAADHAGRSAAVDQAFDEIRWLASVSRTPDPGHRLLLVASALERILPRRSSERWGDAVNQHLRRWWSENAATDEVFACATNLSWFPRSNTTNIGVAIGSDTATVNLPTAVRNLASRARELPAGSVLRADAEELVGYVSTGTRTVAWFRSLDQDFDRLLQRWRRQRNAITHGTPVDPVVVGSVSQFANTLHHMAINAVFSTVADRKPRLSTVLQTINNDLELRRARLADGENWGDVLEHSERLP
ncbi:MAG: hypothetical protein JWM90_2356 [Thermoleophilia bacterium]|nr:hypothetical protein [Thermoleophilia bacterium]